MVRNLPAMQETQVPSLDQEDLGEGNGNPLHSSSSCLRNAMDRGTWQGPEGCKRVSRN